MKKIEISEDQNTVTVDGVKYKAAEYTTCEDCAFVSPNNTITPPCRKTECTPSFRKDRKNVIFKKSEK